MKSISSSRGQFLVNSLAILYNPKLKKILIGRRENDPLVKNLTWSFPGGVVSPGANIKASLKKEVKKKTGLAKVSVKELIFARIPTENKNFLLLYYFCTTSSVRAVAKGNFLEVKWVKPSECGKYFKTSLAPEIKHFIASLYG